MNADTKTRIIKAAKLSGKFCLGVVLFFSVAGGILSFFHYSQNVPLQPSYFLKILLSMVFFAFCGVWVVAYLGPIAYVVCFLNLSWKLESGTRRERISWAFCWVFLCAIALVCFWLLVHMDPVIGSHARRD